MSGFLLRPTWINLHVWAGVTAAALLLARVLWGIWGSKNARFAGFVKGPREVLAHMKELRAGKAALWSRVPLRMRIRSKVSC